VNHAVQAGEGSAAALISVGVELLLCQDVTTRLTNNSQHGFPKGRVFVATGSLLRTRRRPWQIGFTCRMMWFADCLQGKSNRRRRDLVRNSKGRRRVTASVEIGSESGEQEGQLIKRLFPFSLPCLGLEAPGHTKEVIDMKIEHTLKSWRVPRACKLMFQAANANQNPKGQPAYRPISLAG
jgi:hypothetical protein